MSFSVKFSHELNIILYKAIADLKSEASRGYLGFLSWFIEPILYMAVFYVAFGLLFKRGTEDFIPFLLVGLVCWRWFHTTLMNAASSIINNRGLIQQVYLPKYILATVSVAINTFKFLIVFLILLLFLFGYGYDITFHYLYLIPVFFTQLILIISLSYLFASIVPFFPDLKMLLDNGLRAVFFLTGIFFATDTIPEQYLSYFYINPMATIIESYREILLYNEIPSFKRLGIIFTVSMITLLVGLYLLRRNDCVYPRLVR